MIDGQFFWLRACGTPLDLNLGVGIRTQDRVEALTIQTRDDTHVARPTDQCFCQRFDNVW